MKNFFEIFSFAISYDFFFIDIYQTKHGNKMELPLLEEMVGEIN
jgi:hypothetical protein